MFAESDYEMMNLIGACIHQRGSDLHLGLVKGRRADGSEVMLLVLHMKQADGQLVQPFAEVRSFSVTQRDSYELPTSGQILSVSQQPIPVREKAQA